MTSSVGPLALSGRSPSPNLRPSTQGPSAAAPARLLLPHSCQKQGNLGGVRGWRPRDVCVVMGRGNQQVGGPAGLDLHTPTTEEAMEQCPYDPDHRVPVRSMERHKASCSRRKMGYSAEEEAEMVDPSVCYENSVRSFTMDKSTQHQVILQARSAAPLMRMEGVFWQGQYSGQPVDVPENHKRAVCDLTVADRLALYDHVVSVNQQKEAASSSNDDLYVDLVSKLQKDEQQNEPKTHLELMAEMRDYKRRRQSYRAKNVHITKKSYTEVIREVINVHSEELTRQWREEEDESTRSELSSQRRRLDERRSGSSESRHSHSRRHRSRERSEDRESKKKRKKRERDSRSPDDRHHHDRKKKKKKKKEEKEK